MASKKKRGNFMIIFLLIILVLVIMIFLLFNGGLGLGFGTNLDNNNNNNSGTEQSISDTLEISENAETELITESITEMLVLEITVMGNIYLYQNKEIILVNLMSEIQAQQNDFMVCITDDNATQNAMEDLLTALENAEITYAMN